MNDSSPRWTDEQRRAICTGGAHLLVSAAAGSGKTAVLAERCAHFVCDAQPPCDVDQLLVVTFTRAAASEMRSRIEIALQARQGKRADRRLRRQLMLLERAQINTVHGFCTSVLRQHFNLAGLDPGFRMIDDEEAALLRLETAREVLGRRYDNDAGGEFQQFVGQYAGGNDELLVQQILRLHDLLCSVVDPAAWVVRAQALLSDTAANGIDGSALGAQLLQLAGRLLADLHRRCVEAAQAIVRIDGPGAYVEQANELRATVEVWRQKFARVNIDALCAEVSEFTVPKAPKVSPDAPNKELAKALLDDAKKQFKAGPLVAVARFTAQQWIDGVRQVIGPTDVLLDLAGEFGQEYGLRKRQAASLDFSDLERLTQRVLENDTAAEAYQRQFRHVLVDEYQDINELQDAILSRLAPERGATTRFEQDLFCVGDVKQSIYRFRLADPRRFMQRDRAYRPQGRVIDLQANFRSRRPLLQAINAVFARIMTADAAEIEYDASHQLRPGIEYPVSAAGDSFAGAPIELHLIPPGNGAAAGHDGDGEEEDDRVELDRAQREAALVAGRIRAIVGADGSPPRLVFDKSLPVAGAQLRPARFGDVVILLRAMQHKATQFMQVLRAAGIPVHTESRSGFFESTEIRDVLALLALLDNARQDIPLAAVLRSPLTGLEQPDDAMARIRLAMPNAPFHLAAARYARNSGSDALAASMKAFFDRLHRWRVLAHQRPVAEVLWQVYEETGYLAFCAGLQDGEQRVANLIELHERARQFGTFQRQGLRRFMRFLESLRDEHDLGQPTIATEVDDAVRIMSIHHSKGLEFPVVIVPDVGKQHNLRDSEGMILVDREGGVGLCCVDEERGVWYPSLPWLLVRERMRRQSLAEEMRVLYVAMTRAREHLILVGTCDDARLNSWKQRWCGHRGPLPDEEILASRSVLDWLGPVAVAAGQDAPPPIEIITHSEEEISALATPIAQRPRRTPLQEKLARLEPLSPPPAESPAVAKLVARLTREYPRELFTRMPAVLSVGAITKEGRIAPGGAGAAFRDEVEFTPELHLPQFARTDGRRAPTELGSAVHAVLEHLDLARPCDADDVRKQIAGLVDRRFIPAAAAAGIDVEAIAWLMASPLGTLMRRNVKTLRRELAVIFPVDVPGDSTDPRDRIMVRGRIDAMFIDDGGLVVVDYKTDRVTADTIESRVEFYTPQVQSYRDAVAGITGLPVRSVYLAFLMPRELRKL